MIVRVAELIAEALKRGGLLERREVLALKILDQRDLERAAIVDVDLDARHALSPAMTDA